MKRVLSVLGFVASAMCSGVLFSYYTTGKNPAKVRAAAQEEAADTAMSGIQALNMVPVVTGVPDTVMAGAGEYGQAVNLTVSCGVEGCTLTGNHQHGMCGIEGCIQIGEHSHWTCGIDGCTQTGEHHHGMCGIEGCIQVGEHSHGVCEVAGCTETCGHQHNGVYCYPHSADDGHAYHT